MLDRVLQIEEKIARIEAFLLVVFVLLMLGLATYNVTYRNVLVPIQVWSLSNAKESAAAAQETEGFSSPDEGAAATDESAGAEGFGGGFGGGFGDDSGDSDETAGFGGGFGDEPSEAAVDEPVDDPSAGFGGGFDTDSEDGADGFGGGFGEVPSTSGATASPAPGTSYVAPEMPFLAKAIDAVKLEWIDVLLRQLVLVVGFLGAMLATRRRQHITVDALSKLLSDRALYVAQVVTNLVALIICLLLVKAGSDLVAIGLEFPRELMLALEEWHFQLIFPVGFAMLSLHFAIRIYESAMWALGRAEPAVDLRGGTP